MRDAAAAAIRFTEGRSRADLNGDLQLQFALIRAVEVIGEAASRLSESMRGEHAEIPWRNIIGMRNRLIHGYFDVDLDVLWLTVADYLPPLLATLDEWIATDATES